MAATATLSADDVIALLELAPHPEGGFFRETFRDRPLEGATRAASTAIYFLLAAGDVSRWHAVDATEIWHHYAGAPLLLETASPDGQGFGRLRLGPDLGAGERPQARIAPHHWQRAWSLGGWTLVGCTVAPGFEFAGFKLAPAGFLPDA